jgi:hypothetical protein
VFFLRVSPCRLLNLEHYKSYVIDVVAESLLRGGNLAAFIQ